MNPDFDAPDHQLAASAATGDERAFAWLMRRHKDALYRFIRRYTGDADEAQATLIERRCRRANIDSKIDAAIDGRAAREQGVREGRPAVLLQRPQAGVDAIAIRAGGGLAEGRPQPPFDQTV